jgi:hypothetical protein
MGEISKLGWLIGFVKHSIGQLLVQVSQFATVIHFMKTIHKVQIHKSKMKFSCTLPNL